MALIWGSLVENDNSVSEENIRGQRNFANKIWNVARFVFMYELKSQKSKVKSQKSKSKHQDDKNILNDLKLTEKKVTRLLDKHRLNEAAEDLYAFFWSRFANDYLEKTKTRREDAQKTLEYVLQESLKLLHPFMPFLTERLWQIGRERFDSPLLITAPWPR